MRPVVWALNKVIGVLIIRRNLDTSHDLEEDHVKTQRENSHLQLKE
jgi:hypothetical protein